MNTARDHLWGRHHIGDFEYDLMRAFESLEHKSELVNKIHDRLLTEPEATILDAYSLILSMYASSAYDYQTPRCKLLLL